MGLNVNGVDSWQGTAFPSACEHISTEGVRTQGLRTSFHGMFSPRRRLAAEGCPGGDKAYFVSRARLPRSRIELGPDLPKRMLNEWFRHGFSPPARTTI